MRLTDRIAAPASQLGPDMAHDAETARHILQHFGHILAQLTHGAAASGAAIRIRGDMHRLVARQMIGQWQALGLAGDRWTFFGRCRFADWAGRYRSRQDVHRDADGSTPPSSLAAPKQTQAAMVAPPVGQLRGLDPPPTRRK